MSRDLSPNCTNFCQKLLEAAEEENIEAYTESVREYDSISRLDPWLTSLLLRAKKALGDEQELC